MSQLDTYNPYTTNDIRNVIERTMYVLDTPSKESTQQAYTDASWLFTVWDQRLLPNLYDEDNGRDKHA